MLPLHACDVADASPASQPLQTSPLASWPLPLACSTEVRLKGGPLEGSGVGMQQSHACMRRSPHPAAAPTALASMLPMHEQAWRSSWRACGSSGARTRLVPPHSPPTVGAALVENGWHWGRVPYRALPNNMCARLPLQPQHLPARPDAGTQGTACRRLLDG